jgi:hypothetical protein
MYSKKRKINLEKELFQQKYRIEKYKKNKTPVTNCVNYSMSKTTKMIYDKILNETKLWLNFSTELSGWTNFPIVFSSTNNYIFIMYKYNY